MDRKQALAAIKFAAYHNDSREALRVYVENRISRAAYEKAWAAGVELKKGGMRCTCYRCKIETKG